ncbi:hypothetical protein T310_9042, partial [Rasamsonia emersonii CBS 393.64]
QRGRRRRPDRRAIRHGPHRQHHRRRQAEAHPDPARDHALRHHHRHPHRLLGLPHPVHLGRLAPRRPLRLHERRADAERCHGLRRRLHPRGHAHRRRPHADDGRPPHESRQHPAQGPRDRRDPGLCQCALLRQDGHADAEQDDCQISRPPGPGIRHRRDHGAAPAGRHSRIPGQSPPRLAALQRRLLRSRIPQQAHPRS